MYLDAYQNGGDSHYNVVSNSYAEETGFYNETTEGMLVLDLVLSAS
jgi:hypothetical protein